jgi:uncharacterized membrane protein YiaA
MVARRSASIAREAARTTALVVSFGLIVYFGMSEAIKIQATQTRLFFVSAVFAVAFGAALLLDHLLRDRVPTDTPIMVFTAACWGSVLVAVVWLAYRL